MKPRSVAGLLMFAAALSLPLGPTPWSRSNGLNAATSRQPSNAEPGAGFAIQMAAADTASAQTIKQAQQLLTDLGFDPGPVDGQTGPRTAKAVRAFQKSVGAPVTGKISGELVGQLERHIAATAQSVALIGLGISRAKIQTLFEQPGVDFKFSTSEPVDGSPRVTGRAWNNMATIELIGPAENLTNASIIFGLPTDDPDARKKNVVYMLGLVSMVMPTWSGARIWLTENLPKATQPGGVRTIHGATEIFIATIKDVGLVIVAMRAAPQ